LDRIGGKAICRNALVANEKRLTTRNGDEPGIAQLSRGDKTPLELFMAGLLGWDSTLRHNMDKANACWDGR
jgi:hypothetical protein